MVYLLPAIRGIAPYLATQSGGPVTDSSTQDIDFSPATGANLPSVTMNMLLDLLTQSDILYKPAPLPRKSFRWFAAVSRENVDCAAPSNIADAHLLFVCGEDEAEALLREKPTAFVLVLAGKKEQGTEAPPPEDCRAEKGFSSKPYRDRMIVIRQQSRFAYFIFKLQSYFTQLLIWQNELDRIVACRGTLTEMLDASTTVIKNFMFVSDNSFNVIARTSNIEPPDNLHRLIIETGCLTPQMIEEKRHRLSEKDYYIKPPSDLTPYARLSRPLYLNHTYFGSLSMSCNATPLTEGLKDLFGILARHIMPLCEMLWRTQVKLNVPHYFFFSKMLEHAEVTDEYVRSQMELAHLADDTEFKLIVMEVDGETEPDHAARAILAAIGINKGDVFCFPYQNATLVLCHTPPSDSMLSHIKTIEDLSKRIYQPLGIISGVSEVFTGITNLDLAYRQAKIALGLKNTISSEQFASEHEASKGVYLFGDALLYFLVDPSDKDARFMSFCFQHTILEKIYEEDQQNDTNYLALFWFYLYYGRNATAVAQRLYMHRNTVLYHIEKLQKRFDFDLSWRTARDRMMLDFKVFFLTMSHESIEKIFIDVQDDAGGNKA